MFKVVSKVFLYFVKLFFIFFEYLNYFKQNVKQPIGEECTCVICQDGKRLNWSSNTTVNPETIPLLNKLWFYVQHRRKQEKDYRYTQGESTLFFSLLGILVFNSGSFTNESIENFRKRYLECLDLYYPIFSIKSISNYTKNNFPELVEDKALNDIYRKKTRGILMSRNYILKPAMMLDLIHDKNRSSIFLKNLYGFIIFLTKISINYDATFDEVFSFVFKNLKTDIDNFITYVPDIGINLDKYNNIIFTDLTYFKFNILGIVLTSFDSNKVIYVDRKAKGIELVSLKKTSFFSWCNKLDILDFSNTDFGKNW
jgi:hypothetical protein